MKSKQEKTQVYNKPTQYDTDKVKIIRIELDHDLKTLKLQYAIVFQGLPENLQDDELLMQQATIHLEHENLTGFIPELPWGGIKGEGEQAERRTIFYQICLP